MIWTKWIVVVNVFWAFTLSRADTEVSCVFLERCILPCSFQSGPGLVIRWIHVTARQLCIHYETQDYWQDRSGRMLLFKDQISSGNASLQLTRVLVQDEGKYKCHTITENEYKESFIILKVDAPVHQVDIKQVENRITCFSEGIYPEPELTWSSNSPANNSLQYKTSVQQTEHQLYNISSSLTRSDSSNDVIYSCTISSRRSKRTATLAKPVSDHFSHVGAIVGSSLAVILFLGAVLVVVVCCIKKIKGQRYKTAHSLIRINSQRGLQQVIDGESLDCETPNATGQQVTCDSASKGYLSKH